MKTNLPISQKEFSFPTDKTLISVTDKQGRITYCNSNFIQVSGYTRDELLGMAHNLVRHPDMPEEAFRDMWETLKSGRPWSALVKNRRKDGDHYWVRANASPVRDGGNIVGYMSVRTAPSRKEIAAAESLYAKMTEEARSGRQTIRLAAGRVVSNGIIATMSRRLVPSKKTRITLLIAAAAMAPALAAGLDLPAWWGAVIGLVFATTAISSLWGGYFKPVNDIQQMLELVAAGDLSTTREARYSGQFGQMELALTQLILGVRTVIRDARQDVGDLRTGSKEISQGSQELSARAEAQASSLEQTAAALEEITGTVRNTFQLAQDGSKLAHEAMSVSNRSLEAVQSARDTMAEIESSSKKIAEVLQLIESIAFQTNILALNAAVEAARAGEQGRGFAVVAAEVRALAQRTTTAALDVRRLIDVSNTGVGKGAERTNQALERMRESMAVVAKTAEILSQIEVASREQDLGISQINQAVAHLDSITQQNAAMSEDLATVSVAQDRLVEHVHSTIRVFKLAAPDKTVAEEDAVALRKAIQMARAA